MKIEKKEVEWPCFNENMRPKQPFPFLSWGREGRKGELLKPPLSGVISLEITPRAF